MRLLAKDRRRRTLGLTVAVVTTVALALVPLRAFAGTREANAAAAAGATNLTVQLRAAAGPGGSTRYTISVLNNGPDDLSDGDYRVVVEWSAGRQVIGQPGSTPCVEVSTHHCVMDGVAVEFFEGPVSGPGEVTYQITLNGVDQGFFIDIREVDFSMIRDDFPDFGLQPPVLCFGRSCQSV